MALIPIDQIDYAYIERLIENTVYEDSHIEYKAELKFKTDDDKKELLADVSSFANAGGGNIIYGVKEGQEGEPAIISPLDDFRLDEGIARIRSILEDGIDPRVPGLEIRAITEGKLSPLIVIHIPQSWLAPHMMTLKGRSRFVARKGNIKHDLNVQEIRNAFAMSEELPRRIERFRDERLALILSDRGIIPVGHTGKIVIHFIPMSAVAGRTQIEMEELIVHADSGSVFQCTSNSARFNVQGWLKYVPLRSKDFGAAYVQYFRNGIIEAVDTTTILPVFQKKLEYKNRPNMESGGLVFVPARKLEEILIAEVMNAVGYFKKAGIEFPIYVYITVTGLQGVGLLAQGEKSLWRAHNEGTDATIQEDVLLLPSIEMSKEPEDVGRFLKPAFDVLWQASGRAFAPHYDKNVNYKH